jgi:MYXO-CTERM domain-containing protein
LKKLVSLAAVPFLAAGLLVAQSQQPPASSTDTETGERTQTTAPRQAEERDWGWIGLLGLAGLAGLRRRNVAVVRTEERFRDREAGGIRRAG